MCRVLGNWSCSKMEFRRDSGTSNGRDDIFQSAAWTKRLAEPVQAQRSTAARRHSEIERKRVVNCSRSKAVPGRIRLGNHRAARRRKRGPWQHVGLHALRQRVCELASLAALLGRMKVLEIETEPHAKARCSFRNGCQRTCCPAIHEISWLRDDCGNQLVVHAAIAANADRKGHSSGAGCERHRLG